ncbi:hypothetical protein [Rossellomorea sp. FM04394]|uniref:hypothetical protein n=1 Tax=Rossellomorea sp. FM04394 TaxID=3243076 RepID=UPI0035A5F857
MKRLMMAGLFFVLVSGCNERGNQVETQLGKQVTDYEPVETDVVNTHEHVENMESSMRMSGII